MNLLQDVKCAIMIAPQSVGTTPVTGVVSAAGYNRAKIVVQMAAAATTVSASTLKLAAGATTAAYTDIAKFTGGTDTDNFTLPAASGTSATGDVVSFDVDLKGRGRELKLSLANSAARISSALVLLSDRSGETPDSATERGLAVQVVG